MCLASFRKPPRRFDRPVASAWTCISQAGGDRPQALRRKAAGIYRSLSEATNAVGLERGRTAMTGADTDGAASMIKLRRTVEMKHPRLAMKKSQYPGRIFLNRSAIIYFVVNPQEIRLSACAGFIRPNLARPHSGHRAVVARAHTDEHGEPSLVGAAVSYWDVAKAPVRGCSHSLASAGRE
jgi:hypothetical protein